MHHPPFANGFATAKTGRRARFLVLVLTLVISISVVELSNPYPSRSQSTVVSVTNAEALLAAIAAAEAGQTIQLEPAGAGEAWDLPNKVVVSRSGSAEAPITLRAESLGEPALRFLPDRGIVEGFLVRAPHWTFENLDLVGACAQADHSRCEHAFHIVGAADHTTLRGLRMEGFNAQIKGNGEDGSGGREWPDDVLVEGSELFNRSPRNTGNPVTPIDVVGGRRWTVRANFIHDFAKAGGNQISYGAFLKGNSKDGLFERNLVVCEQLHRGQIRLGLSLGGGGSNPDPICEEGSCTPEHQRGILRNNIIAHCPADVGIYLNESADSRVHHNLLYDTGGGIDVRFGASSVDLRGNLMSGRIRERDGGRATGQDNLENLSAADFQAWFRDPANLDFALRDGSGFVDVGQPLDSVPDDYCGRPRDDGAPDLGAVEYGGDEDCDTTSVHPPSSAPTPPASETPPATSPATEPVATVTMTASPSPTPPFDFFIGGRVIDGNLGGEAGVGNAIVSINGCDASVLRFPTRPDGSYFGALHLEFVAGCDAWEYLVTAPGFVPLRETVALSEVQQKDFRILRQPLLLPMLVDGVAIRR